MHSESEHFNMSNEIGSKESTEASDGLESFIKSEKVREVLEKIRIEKYKFATASMYDRFARGEITEEQADKILNELQILSLEHFGFPITEAFRWIDDARGLAFYEEWSEMGIDKEVIASSLGGLDSDEIWEMREALVAEGVPRQKILEGLSGIDSERAWQFRRSCETEGLNANGMQAYARSLAGLDSELAWQSRDQYLTGNIDDLNKQRDLLDSIVGVDSERAWKLREQSLMANELSHPFNEAIAESLAGLDTDRAWEFRDELYLKATLASLTRGQAGLNSERAWNWREKMRTRPVGDRSVTESIVQSIFGTSHTNPKILQRHLYHLPDSDEMR